MAHTPHDILAANFGVSPRAMEKMPAKEKFIFQADVPGPLAEDKKALLARRAYRRRISLFASRR